MSSQYMLCGFGHPLKTASRRKRLYYCDHELCKVAHFKSQRKEKRIFFPLDVLPDLMLGELTKQQVEVEYS